MSDNAEEDDLWFLPVPLEEDDLPLEYLLDQRPRRGEITPQEPPRGEPYFPRVPEGRDMLQAECIDLCSPEFILYSFRNGYFEK